MANQHRRYYRIYAVSTCAIVALAAAADDVGNLRPYRAIPYPGTIWAGFSGPAADGLVFNRWPSRSSSGEGLRFRFTSPGIAVGTTTSTADSDGSLSSLRAAAWRMGSFSGPHFLPLPDGFVGSIATDANREGCVVGGLVHESTKGHLHVQASAWVSEFSTGGHFGPMSIGLAFSGMEFDDCTLRLPASLLTAVGPRSDGGAGAAMVAGIVSMVNTGAWNDGILGSLSDGALLNDIQRLPGLDASDAGWCGSWENAVSRRCAVVQCIASPHDGSPTSWADCHAIGSRRVTVGSGPLVLCVDTQAWDYARWTVFGEFEEIPRCDVCSVLTSIPSCARSQVNPGRFETVTDIRMSSNSSPDPGLGAPSVSAGLLELRSSDDYLQLCDSSLCSQMRAAVAVHPVTGSGTIPSLLDLHDLLPGAVGSADSSSAIARITRLGEGARDGRGGLDWIAVGAASIPDVEGSIRTFGALWRGRSATDGSTEWCAWNINEITHAPSGLVLDSVHDVDARGIALAVATDASMDGSSVVKRLVLLTSLVDLNADLVTDGLDLGILLGAWGVGQDQATRAADLNQDGSVDGIDLGVLIGAWGGVGAGGLVNVAVGCPESGWESPSRRFPYVERASGLLGFLSMNQLGETMKQLPADHAESLGSVVDVLAAALEGE
jgi:hypothetical protein